VVLCLLELGALLLFALTGVEEAEVGFEDVAARVLELGAVLGFGFVEVDDEDDDTDLETVELDLFELEVLLLTGFTGVDDDDAGFEVVVAGVVELRELLLLGFTDVEVEIRGFIEDDLVDEVVVAGRLELETEETLVEDVLLLVDDDTFGMVELFVDEDVVIGEVAGTELVVLELEVSSVHGVELEL
jgi:hypothetical protein